MEIKTYNFPLEGELKKRVENLLSENFPVKEPEIAKWSKNTHYSNPVEYILYFDEDKLIGAQNIFLREIEFEGQKVLIGGLGGLCVNEAYRGKGIAQKLLSSAMEEMRKLNCDIGMLFTDVTNPRFQKLYGKFGFVVLGREYSLTDKNGQVQKDTSCMIAPINSEEKFNLILNSKQTPHIGAGEW